MAAKNVLSRREFVKDTGGLLIGFSLADSAVLPQVLAAAAEVTPTPSPNRLDAWLRIDRDGTVHVFTGKAEIGMGVETGFAQIVAEELDVPLARVVFVMGDTSSTADQGGVGGSTSIALGSKPLRNASATARALLLRLAAKNLGASPGELQVREGVVSVKADPARRSRAQNSRQVAIRHGRARARNAARPRGSSGRGGRQADGRGRLRSQENSRLPADCDQGQFSRRR